VVADLATLLADLGLLDLLKDVTHLLYRDSELVLVDPDAENPPERKAGPKVSLELFWGQKMSS
jgi:hypothetical protein